MASIVSTHSFRSSLLACRLGRTLLAGLALLQQNALCL